MPKQSNNAKRRGQSWTDAETLALFSAWQELHVEENLDDPHKNNSNIYKSVSAALEDCGFEKSAEQCKTKMHTLKRSYRSCKAKMNKSGSGRSTCKFFDKMQEIFGNRPASSPVKVIESLLRKRVQDVGNEDEGSDNDGDTDDNDLEHGSTEFEDKSFTMKYTSGGSPHESHGVDLSEDVETDPDVDPLSNLDKGVMSRSKDQGKGVGDNTLGVAASGIQEKGSSKAKKARKTKLEIALSTAFNEMSKSNEKVEDKYVELERKKVEVEIKRIEMEKLKMESEERQRREERQHQFSMMQMILGSVGQNRPGAGGNMNASWMGQRTSRQHTDTAPCNPGADSDVSYDSYGSSFYNM
ncbi:uncharacterized protein [Haliotis asinina]|uniref:uncharacterized protein n=1 Tax=Haliotis asinina TaxID=109174 RepID=UPI00353279DF